MAVYTKLNQKKIEEILSNYSLGKLDSFKGIEDGIECFFITTSGKKYESLKPEDIVFLSLTEEKDFLSWFNSGKNPSSEWRFHQDIYKNKWEAKAIVHAHSPHATAVSTHGKSIRQDDKYFV